MKERFFESIDKDETTIEDEKVRGKRIKFEDFVDKIGVNLIEFTSFYARKLSKMEPLENRRFKVFIEYAKLRMKREEWSTAYYYLNSIFFDAFRDSENEEKNERRNEIIDLMNECLEKMRIEDK